LDADLMSHSNGGSNGRGGLSTGSHLLVQAGEYVCALPLVSVRRVVRSLTVHPLPGSAPELEGLAEFGGEPLPVLNLARMVNAAPGANPSYPVTVVVWAGRPWWRAAAASCSARRRSRDGWCGC
jgi:chemotaxis signal transduction protein